MMLNGRSWIAAALAVSLLSTVAACGSDPNREAGASRLSDGGGGGGFLGFGKKSASASGQNEIGVNSFLWRASLDTLAFMPLVSADPNGGTIITDWYASPEQPKERFKATVYILDTRLRADGLKVAVNKQGLTANGWVDATIDPDVAIQLENKILVRARELRLSTLSN